jgi:site-specific DNA-cytosine methylase
MKHATIIPLIGGEALAATHVFGNKPEYILSYDVFKENEKHLLNYWDNSVPYHVLDKGGSAPLNERVNVISSVCPCAGLSQYHSKPGEQNENNQWMEKTAKYILGEVKPDVFWGENAPALVGKIGDFMLQKLRQIGKENGYSMSLYLTKNIKHGIPQFRKRTFYFFWKKSEFGENTPVLNYYNRPHQKIEDIIAGVKSNFQQVPINPKTPSKDDPYYRYLLEEVHGGITHREYFELLETKNVRGNDVESLIERSGHDYKTVGEWMLKEGYEKEIAKCDRKYEKLKAGGNIMRRGTIIPKDYIGAFVGHYPTVLTHPYEDRYITYREAMTIMGLPDDFELLDEKKSINHICQNVPFQTAADMSEEIKAVYNGERGWSDTDFFYQSNINQKSESWNVAPEPSLEEFFA